METILHIDNDRVWKDIVSHAFAKDDNIELVGQEFASLVLAGVEDWQYALLITELSGDDRSKTEGLEVIRLLAEKNPSIPVVVLSRVLTVDRIVRAADLPNVKKVLPKQGVPDYFWLRDIIKRAALSS